MAAATKEPKKVKKGFKMPHLFWIMFGLLMLSSIMTYIIPAGQFATDPETGAILGDQFNYLGYQTPVSPLRVMLLIIDGMTNSALVGYSVMISGAMVGIILGTGAFDEFMNWAIYKLKDKDDTILVAVMFCLMVYLGAFGGSDALIAIVPVGVMFAKKLKLDPICAIGCSTYATLIGFGTGPTKQATTQLLMGVQIYGTFFTMFISMNIFMLVGMFFLLRYVRKIRKDPTTSPMWSEGWRPDDGAVYQVVQEGRTLESRLTVVAVGNHEKTVSARLPGEAVDVRFLRAVMIRHHIGHVNNMHDDAGLHPFAGSPGSQPARRCARHVIQTVRNFPDVFCRLFRETRLAVQNAADRRQTHAGGLRHIPDCYSLAHLYKIEMFF